MNVAQPNRSDRIAGLDGYAALPRCSWSGTTSSCAPGPAPRRSRAVRGQRFQLRTFRGDRVHRAVRILAGPGPARSGWRSTRSPAFARRRAWRILPPYWAALAFSLADDLVRARAARVAPAGRELGRRLRTARARTSSPTGSPNRAFWSIAIEVQLYLLLPLLLLLARRMGAVAMAAASPSIVVAVGVVGPHVPAVNTGLLDFTPDLAVLFAVGVLTSPDRRQPATVPSARRRGARSRSGPRCRCGVDRDRGHGVGRTTTCSGSTSRGCRRSVPARGVGHRATAAAVRVLRRPPLRSLGSFSYSL